MTFDFFFLFFSSAQLSAAPSLSPCSECRDSAESSKCIGDTTKSDWVSWSRSSASSACLSQPYCTSLRDAWKASERKTTVSSATRKKCLSTIRFEFAHFTAPAPDGKSLSNQNDTLSIFNLRRLVENATKFSISKEVARLPYVLPMLCIFKRSAVRSRFEYYAIYGECILKLLIQIESECRSKFYSYNISRVDIYRKHLQKKKKFFFFTLFYLIIFLCIVFEINKNISL